MAAKARLRLDGADPINRGLVGFWPLTDGAGGRAWDISPYRRDGTLANFSYASGSGWASKPFGRALTTDGSNDYVDFTSAAIEQNGNFTISFWFQYATANRAIFGRGADALGDPWSISCQTDATNKLVAWVVTTSGGAAGYGGAGSTTLSTSAWYHATFVYRETDTLKAYLNGREEISASLLGTSVLRTANSGIWLGRGENAGTSYFNGSANNLRIFKRALTPSEVARLYRDPWAGTLRTRRRVLATTGTQYSLATDPLSYEHAVGDAGLGWGRTIDTEPLSYEHAVGGVDFIVRRTMDAEAVAYGYTVPTVGLSYEPAAVGDTHDGFVRRSRRERALDAAERRRRVAMVQEATALRLSLEAAMGMAAEVAEEAPQEAAEAVQAVAKRAARLVPTLGDMRADEALLATAREVVTALRAVVDEAARAKALADDDEEVMMLLRAL